jgi:predicted phage terminase large subunit-like protein
MKSAIAEAYELERKLSILRAQRGLLGFTLQTYPDYEVSWHHRRTCQLVNAMQYRQTPRQLLATWGITGKALSQGLDKPHPVTRLYLGMTNPDMLDAPINGIQVCLPPRHGKSELISRRMPAWMLGVAPDTAIISCSYGADLASRMNRDVQRIIDTPQYEQTFPNTRLNSSNVRSVSQGTWLRNSDIFEVVGHKGVYRSSGIGGGITGLGANCAIIDDPFKSRKTAESPVERQTVIDWYGSTLYTRLEKNAAKVIINTRWHESDLSGYTMQHAFSDPTADQWFCAVFPAILDCDPGVGDPRREGEALWPEKYSVKRLKQIRSTIGAYEFEALYQQRPAPPEGGIIKDAWWKYYDVLPEGLRNWAISVDLSFADRGDFSAFTVWANKGSDHYIVDLLHGRMTFTEQVKGFEMLCQKYPHVRAKYVEAAANGAALIDTLKRKVPGIIGVRPEGSKQLRVDAVSPLFEAGNIWLPSKRLAPWSDMVTHEFRNFPNGAHDDIVDSVSQYLAKAANRLSYISGAAPGSITRASPWLG